jgi:excisionase family DNA binding protein
MSLDYPYPIVRIKCAMELTTGQAAERLGVNPARIRQLVLAGVIKARKPSPRVMLIDERELEKPAVKDRRGPGRPWPKKKGR